MEQYRSPVRRGALRANRGTKYTKVVILAVTLVLLILMHINWITLDTSGYDTAYEYHTWSLVTAVLDGYLPVGLLLLYIVRLLVRGFAFVMFISTLALLVRRDGRYKKRFLLACLGMIAMFLFTLFLVLDWNTLALSKIIIEKTSSRPFSMTGAAVAACVFSVLTPFLVMPLLKRLK